MGNWSGARWVIEVLESLPWNQKEADKVIFEEKARWGGGLQDGFESRRLESGGPAPFTADSGRPIVTANI